MKTYQIKHRFNGSVLFGIECGSLKIALEAAITSKADLRGADLTGAFLTGADLTGADLTGAFLRGAKIRENTYIEKTPIQITGGSYPVIIWDNHMQIGCEFHSLRDWFSYDDTRIMKMDGKRALSYWCVWKKSLMQVCISNVRYELAEAAA